MQSVANSHSHNFRSTRWSVVRQLQNTDASKAEEALALLCEIYWYPIYAFIRRTGIKPHDAEDLAQGFFCRFLTNNSFAAADQEKGKLRTFLLTCLKNYLGNERDRGAAQKRGAALLMSMDVELAEALYRDESSTDDSPDTLFQRRWAFSVLDSSMTALAKEYQNKGKLFTELRPFLGFGPEPEKSYEKISEELGIPEGTLKSQVHRLRDRWRELLFEQVGMTLDNPSTENIRSELQELLGSV